jgi:hypothetical protein
MSLTRNPRAWALGGLVLAAWLLVPADAGAQYYYRYGPGGYSYGGPGFEASRYYNPRTGRSGYRGSYYDPWSGRVYSDRGYINPRTGRYGQYRSYYNPWTGVYEYRYFRR